MAREIDGLTVGAEYNVRADGKNSFRTVFQSKAYRRGLKLLSDEENYRQLDKLISPSVGRVFAEENFWVGEPEEAIATLLDEAFTAGCLADRAVEFIEERYDDGPVYEMLEALQMYKNENSVA